MAPKFLYPLLIPASSHGDSETVVQCLGHTLMCAESAISSLFQLRLVIHVVDTNVRHAGLMLVLLSLFPLFMGNRHLFGKCECIFDVKFTRHKGSLHFDQHT